MAAAPSNNPTEDISPADAHFFLECLRNIDKDGMVDISKVSEALGYTNTGSTGNRFRLLRKKHGIKNLECKNSSPSKAKAPLNPATRSPKATKPKSARAVTPKRARKGAKVSAKPIPATRAMKREGSEDSTGEDSDLDDVPSTVGVEGVNKEEA